MTIPVDMVLNHNTHLLTFLLGNKLKDLPDSLCCLKNLRSLDISNNPQLTILPRQLCQVRSLETIILDGEMFVDPPSNICSQGTEAIMTYLCGGKLKKRYILMC